MTQNPCYVQPFSEVFNEDCIQVMKRYPDKFFDLAVVDPPYGIGANKMQLGNAKDKVYRGENDWDKQTPTAEYWEQLFRVSKNQIVWGANWYGKYFGVGGLVWFKDNTGNYSPCEYAYQSINNHIHHYQYRWNGMLQQNMKQKEERIHPTQKPVALYDWILQKFAKEGNLILDTHLGSGSSRIACFKGGFNFVGFEIDAEYYDKQQKRFNDFKSQLRMF